MSDLPARSCGDCTLCCKVLHVVALDKPRNQWCEHCVVGKGCGFYETRPEECRTFNCIWLTNSAFGEDWKPNVSKFVMTTQLNGFRTSIFVDPQRPNAWREEPYLSTFRAWAKDAAIKRRQVVVFVHKRAFVILPDRIEDLGNCEPDDLILTSEVATTTGTRLEVRKVAKDDPNISQAQIHVDQRS